jgi:hypothetical protein
MVIAPARADFGPVFREIPPGAGRAAKVPAPAALAATPARH